MVRAVRTAGRHLLPLWGPSSPPLADRAKKICQVIDRGTRNVDKGSVLIETTMGSGCRTSSFSIACRVPGRSSHRRCGSSIVRPHGLFSPDQSCRNPQAPRELSHSQLVMKVVVLSSFYSSVMSFDFVDSEALSSPLPEPCVTIIIHFVVTSHYSR